MLDHADYRPRPRPQQRRSAETVARIIQTAALLLDEVGFDKLTTNLICERAGLTPPALYRHFPNKYAVMEELGRRLMETQNEVLYKFLQGQPDALLPQSALATMLMGQLEYTRKTMGGRWIMRSLHSTPGLVEVRLESHHLVTDALYDRHLALAPGDASARLKQAYRVAVEIGFATMELVLDEPELDADVVVADGALMIDTLLSSASR